MNSAKVRLLLSFDLCNEILGDARDQGISVGGLVLIHVKDDTSTGVRVEKDVIGIETETETEIGTETETGIETGTETVIVTGKEEATDMKRKEENM